MPKDGLPPATVSTSESTKEADGLGAAASAFLSSFASSAKQPNDSTADPNVSVAFALGWQMADLYRPNHWRTHASQRGKSLPGLSQFSALARTCIGLDRVDMVLNQLHSPITQAGLTPPSTAAVREALKQDTMEDTFRERLFDLHVELMSTLTAASFRLGTSYGLGRALADTCGRPKDVESLKTEFKPHRIAALQASIADLTTVLPAHVGRSVADSMLRWRDWAATQDGANPDEEARTIRLLRRQGERWRALMSAEKSATDLLELQDYVSAGAGMFKRMRALTWRFLWRFLPAVLLALALFAGGMVLIVRNTHSGHIAAGIGALLASLGLTWKGVGASLGKTAARLEHPVWEAELDAAITTALTLLPGSQRTSQYTPPLTKSERAHQLDPPLHGQSRSAELDGPGDSASTQ